MPHREISDDLALSIARDILSRLKDAIVIPHLSVNLLGWIPTAGYCHDNAVRYAEENGFDVVREAFCFELTRQQRPRKPVRGRNRFPSA